jgi:hypothetical protein
LREVLRRIFGPKRRDVIGGWRKVHNKELHNLYSRNIRIVKLRMKWMRHVEGMVQKRNTKQFYVINL